jgi:hypothetical protein
MKVDRSVAAPQCSAAGATAELQSESAAPEKKGTQHIGFGCEGRQPHFGGRTQVRTDSIYSRAMTASSTLRSGPLGVGQTGPVSTTTFERRGFPLTDVLFE